MTLVAWMMVIIVGIVAFGIGKLSVYAWQDKEMRQSVDDDRTSTLDPGQYARLSAAQDHEIAAERDLAKLIATLSFAAIAGVTALGQLTLIGAVGVVILSLAFFLPVMLSIANLQLRQSLLNTQARRLRDAFLSGEPLRRRPQDDTRHRVISALPKIAAVMFCVVVVLVVLALAASRANCALPHAGYHLDRLYCSDFAQMLTRND